jgi:UDP-GlcNAc:undecaprenyl-phosphate GlcNAc-1-phosphate transferase
VAIYGAFFITIAVALFFDSGFRVEFGQRFYGLLAGGAIILALGIYDDCRGSVAWLKLLIQLFAAVVLISYGCKVSIITNPFSDHFNLGFLSVPITIVWVIGVTNAINLIDGLDGLAAGVTSIILLTLFLVAYYRGHHVTIVLTLALGGSTLGFLRYNFNPAKIFMGDSGSLFLGFALAAIAVEGSQKSATAVAFLIPIIAMGLPLMDTLLAMGRRVTQKRNPFRADNGHLHHRLLTRGLSHKKAVLAMYFFCLCLGAVSFVFATVKDEFIGILLLVIGLVVFVGIRRLGMIRYWQEKNG